MIEKITDHNLERYDSRLKEWCDRKFFEKGNYGKYETTEEAGTVAFYPAPDTPLEGKVKFSFKETMPASGDKSPENPSAISGVSEVKVMRCGKNLLPIPAVGTTTINQVNFTVNADGSITVNGTASADTNFFISSNKIPTFGKTIFISGCPSGGSSSTYSLHLAVYNGSIVTFVNDDFGSGYLYVNANPRQIIVSIRIKSGFTANNLIFYPQIEFSSTATSFESYSGNDYTIELGNTFYGGFLDVATGIMTVTHRTFVIDETTTMSTSGYAEGTDAYRIGYYLPNKEITPRGYAVPFGYTCNIMPVVMDPSPNGSLCFGLGGASYLCYIRFPKQLIGAGDGLSITAVEPLAKAWLAQHPITVTYPMAETNYQTVQLTSAYISALVQVDKYTPRLNTVYTNADSIQISYLKSPIRDEYEKTQAILSLGGNS